MTSRPLLPASVRLGWATRGGASPGVVASVAAATALALGAFVTGFSREPSPLFAYWCSGILTAVLVGADFPGASQARWAEFELSLPVAPRDRARVSLLMSFGFWLAPLVVALLLGQVGAFGAGQHLPALQLLRSFASAMVGVLLAVALRHTLGLRLTGLRAAALRIAMVAAVALGFAQLSPVTPMLMLALAAPLLGHAHRAATRAPELRLTRSVDSASSAAASTTFDRIALRYVLGSPYAIAMLGALLLWVFALSAGWLRPSGANGQFLLVWVAYHVAYGARLLRLGYLPTSRERLFRFVAWPSLGVIVLGVGLAVVLRAPNELGRLELEYGPLTLQSSARSWQLTSEPPPLIVAPNGESHRPSTHSVGLGALLSAYDPYEVPRDASQSYLQHQLGRLIAEQRGLALTPDTLQRRFLFSPDQHIVGDDSLPELGSAWALRADLARAAALIVLALLAMHAVIRPGPALSARAWRRQPWPWLLIALFVIAALPPLLTLDTEGAVDPVFLLSAAGQALADHWLATLALALIFAALLYRNLRARFTQMEASARAKSMDDWFVEI
ncbi:MAG TPA: hypothetical protein VMG12_14855 [Polyangiaceae bacterium]|nr:hypothetical protein [Polyangiaceae bacterium]